MKFNDQHIPDSPFLVPAVAPANDARRLTVTGLQVRHEETPPQPAGPALLKGSGAQLHKYLMLGTKKFHFKTNQMVFIRWFDRFS